MGGARPPGPRRKADVPQGRMGGELTLELQARATDGWKADAGFRTINMEAQRQRKAARTFGPPFLHSACGYSPIVGSSSSS
jgi:hypothetical protein